MAGYADVKEELSVMDSEPASRGGRRRARNVGVVRTI
jgi:hypothetical protein